MTIKSAIIVVAGVLTFSGVVGCTGVEAERRPDERTTRELAGLRTSLTETRAELEELSNKFMLLHEKVEANRSSALRGFIIPDAPPEGLKVVSLGVEAKSRRKVKVRKPKKKTARKPPPAPVASGEKVESAGALYNKGQDLFIAGKYSEARKTFLRLAEAYPKHSLSDNAFYWTGEAYYSEKDFAAALVKFKEVVRRYPDENKAPDALLKVAFSHIELNDLVEARGALNRLLDRYPDSTAADKAEKILNKHSGLKKEGAR